MAGSTITSAQVPEGEQTQAVLNEPSMEDILASIRRIIAEDQSNGLGRGGLTGLTRRARAAEPAPVAAVVPAAPAAPQEPEALAVAAPAEVEAALPHAVEGDMLAASYEAPADQHEDVRASELDALGLSDIEDLTTSHGPEQSFPSETAPLAVDVDEAGGALLSPETGASITSSFHALAESMVMQDPELIERIMRETMRPLLKEWLDDHLPSIVERLVRAEIERVARGARGRD